MRSLQTSESAILARDAFRLTDDARKISVSLLVERDATVDQLRDWACAGDLLEIARALRDLLTPVAYRVEETELFRLVSEMEVEAAAARTKRWGPPGRYRGPGEMP
jgi:hypothetical protein